MKKLPFGGIIVVVLILIGGSIIVLFNSNKQESFDRFSLEEYRWEIDNFPANKNVGEVGNHNVAIEKAKELWRERFGVSDSTETEVAWDSENECWHINNIPPADTLGGVYHAIIQKNGDVIAVWLDD